MAATSVSQPMSSIAFKRFGFNTPDVRKHYHASNLIEYSFHDPGWVAVSGWLSCLRSRFLIGGNCWSFVYDSPAIQN